MTTLKYPEVGVHGLPEAGEAVAAEASLVAPMNADPAFDESELDSLAAEQSCAKPSVMDFTLQTLRGSSSGPAGRPKAPSLR